MNSKEADRQVVLSTFDDELPQLSDEKLREFPNALEWWYFDLATPDQLSLVVCFARKNSLFSSDQADVYIEYKNPQAGHSYSRIKYYPLEAFTCARSNDEVLLALDARNQLKIRRGQEDGIASYHLSLKIGDFEAVLEFAPLHRGFKPGANGCYFRHRDRPELHNCVNFAAPRMSASGTITLRGQSLEVRGEGYHDHPWGTDNYFNSTAGWNWGRLYNDQVAIMYAELQPSVAYTGSLRFLYVASAGKFRPAIALDFELNVSDWKASFPYLFFSIPRDTRIVCQQPRIEVTARYHSMLLNTPVYNRSQVTFQGSVSGGGTGWTEYMKTPYFLRGVLARLFKLMWFFRRA